MQNSYKATRVKEAVTVRHRIWIQLLCSIEIRRASKWKNVQRAEETKGWALLDSNQ